jgi:DNA-binding NtrC family response regulator
MTQIKAKILVVDDDKDILTAARYLLERHYQTVLTCADPTGISGLMKDAPPDVILLDMNFQPGASDGELGLQWLEQILRADPDAVVVMITAHGSLNVAVEAMKRGAVDYLAKPWDNQRLLATISSALQLRKSRNEAARLRQSNRVLSQTSQPQTIIGNSPVMQELMSLCSRAAPTDANVLILGENGTGKELVARELHRLSKRQGQVFIDVDLGSIAESLFEAELFGHRKGAFTDAKDDRIGYIEAANGGTLFLDEIGNLPLHLQAKLLAVLEKREVSQVGSTTAIPVDVRIIAATNISYKQLTDPMRFRQDLLFRLNTVEIILPPLRKRPGDLPAIARHFVALYCNKYGKEVKQIKPETLELLLQYAWPGNIRELRHAIERAVILSQDESLGSSDFQFHQQASAAADFTASNDSSDDDAVNAGSEMDLNLERLEYRAITQALRRNRYVISNAAKDLGLTRAALYRRMEKHGI